MQYPKGNLRIYKKIWKIGWFLQEKVWTCRNVYNWLSHGIVWCWRSISCFWLLASLLYMSIPSGSPADSAKGGISLQPEYIRGGLHWSQKHKRWPGHVLQAGFGTATCMGTWFYKDMQRFIIFLMVINKKQIFLPAFYLMIPKIKKEPARQGILFFMCAASWAQYCKPLKTNRFRPLYSIVRISYGVVWYT